MTSPAWNTSAKKFGSASLSGGMGVIPGSAFPSNGVFALEGWFNFTSTDGDYSLFCAGAGVAFDLLGAGNGKLALLTPFGNQFDKGNIDGGVARHVALSSNGSTMILYLNGVGQTYVDGSLAGALTNGVAIRARRSGLGDTANMVGWVDEVALWNSHKYPSDFTPRSAAYAGDEAGLIAAWHLDSNGAKG